MSGFWLENTTDKMFFKNAGQTQNMAATSINTIVSLSHIAWDKPGTKLGQIMIICCP